jgi:hypothetical protein
MRAPFPFRDTADFCHNLKPAVVSLIRNGFAIPRAADSLTGPIVQRITVAVAWALSQFRDLAHHELTPRECEKHGLPEGSTEPHIYINRISNAPWWRCDIWSDGDCLHIRLLGWWSEIHYIPKSRQEVASV